MEKMQNLNIKHINLILQSLHEKKSLRYRNRAIFNIDKILSINIQKCKYVGGINTEIKKHLNIKFTLLGEKGTVCLSVLLDDYKF